MATGDIYRIDVDCSTNNRAWSFGFFVIERDTIGTGDGLTVAKACDATFTAALRALLSTSASVDSYHASKRFLGYNPAGRYYVPTGTGTQSSDALSNDNSLYIGLRQTFAAAKYNGGIYIAGQATGICDGSTWSDTYLSGAVKTFTNLLPGYIDAVSPEVGKWDIVVLSQAYSPPTMVLGTPMDVTSAVANNRVMTQSRRRQRVKGFA